jgi:hypothetical protein
VGTPGSKKAAGTAANKVSRTNVAVKASRAEAQSSTRKPVAKAVKSKAVYFQNPKRSFPVKEKLLFGFLPFR